MTGVNPMSQRLPGGALYVLPLGYTRPPLTLNDRHGWRREAAIKAAIRRNVATRLRALAGPPGAAVGRHLDVELHYAPADRRARDADNLMGTLKPCIDALHAAGKPGVARYPLVIDDTPDRVTWHPPIIEPVDKYGARMWLRLQVTW